MATARVSVRRIDALLAGAPPALDWLSPGELERAARMRAPARHASFLAGHWLLRQLLARDFGGDPRAYALVERDNRPPALAGSDLRLSLSHGGDWIAAAWSRLAIGIDLEPRTPRAALDRLQHLLLNADEAHGSLDNDALLQRWVLKEALIKRDHGSALPDQLAALQLHRTTDGNGAVVLVSSDDWHLAVAPAGLCEIDHDLPIHARSEWSLA